MESQGPPAGCQEPARGLFSVHRPPGQNRGHHRDRVSVPMPAGRQGPQARGGTNSRLGSVLITHLRSGHRNAGSRWPEMKRWVSGCWGARGARVTSIGVTEGASPGLCLHLRATL